MKIKKLNKDMTRKEFLKLLGDKADEIETLITEAREDLGFECAAVLLAGVGRDEEDYYANMVNEMLIGDGMVMQQFTALNSFKELCKIKQMKVEAGIEE